MQLAKALALVIGAGVGTAAVAQTYPSKPVRIIVPFVAGGGIDVIARAVSPKLAELWGQPVTVENHVGASGTVGAKMVAVSAADGYTLLVNSSAQVTSSSLVPNPAYDPLKDFVAIASIASQPYVFVAGKPSGLTSVADLIAAGKARPGALTFGSAGVGTATHLGAEKLNLALGIKAAHIPSDPNEATAGTIAGRVTYWLSPMSLALPHIREGRLQPLAVSSARRTSLLPQVPTVAETGIAGFDFTLWTGMWAPAATPAAVVQKLADDVARMLSAPDTVDRLAKLGAEPMSMSQTDFTKFVRRESDAAAHIIKAAGIKAQ